MADGADLPAGHARHRIANRHGEMRRREHRIVPFGNRRRPRMIRDARDDRLVLVDGDDPLDHANGDAGALERAALLDVQLEIAVMRPLRPPRIENAIRVAADLPDRVGAAHAVPDLVHVRLRDLARGDAAAREPAAEREAFFVCPHDHLEGMSRADAGRGQRLERAERGQRSEVAVEVAAVGDRVDVGSEEDWR